MNAGATAYTWDASGGDPLDDGGGNWNATGGANWNTGASYGAWGNALADTATFGVNSGAAGTITVGTVNCGGITFNAPGSGNYVLDGGTITLNAGGIIAPKTTVTATINSDIAANGTINLQSDGSGTINLNGVISGVGGVALFHNGAIINAYLNNANNSFTGAVSISRGYLYAGANAPSGSNGAFGNSTNAIQLANGNWSHTGVFIAGPYTVGRNINIPADAYANNLWLGGSTADSSVFSGNISLTRGATTDLRTVCLVAQQNGTVTFSGNLSGYDHIQFLYSGACGGDIVLSGDNSGWSGSLDMDVGRLIVGHNNALGTSTNTISVGNYRSNNSPRADKRVGVLTKGPVAVTRILNANNSSSAGDVWFGGTTADASSYTGDITLKNSYNSYFTAAAGGQVTFSGNIIGGGAVPVTKVDAGTVIFAPVSGTNTYTGGTTISAGMLAAGSPNALGTNGTITVSSNGTFGVASGATFSRAVTFNAGSGLGGSGTFNRGAAWTLPANFTLRPGMSTNETGTLTVDTANNALTAATGTRLEIDFTAAGPADKLVVAGTGSLNLSTANDTLVLRGRIKPGVYVIASAAGGITGTFDTVDLSGLESSGVKVSYPGDGTVVVLAPGGTSIIVQ